MNCAGYRGDFEMKTVVMVLVVLGMAVMAAPDFATTISLAQDEDVRGAFLTTRPKTTPKPAAGRAPKANRRRPKAQPSASNKQKTTDKTPPPTTTTDSTPPKLREQKIGLGLTLFMRDANGLSVRVNPSREFRKGERVRLLLETNTDGYLYVFNTTDGGAPVMIYPDPDLDEAGNYIQAHIPVEVPSSTAAEERLRWFRFDEQAGVERLYFVFSREPLSGIPLEDELISYCRSNKANCPMKPADDLWAQIRKDLDAPVKGVASEGYGNTQSYNEQQASTRGIGLSKEDPEPSLLVMTASTNAKTLVTTLDLIHK
jgi:hypothetical protein